MSQGPAVTLFEAEARVQNIIWIPGAVADTECPPDTFRDEFLDNMPLKKDAQLYRSLPLLARFAEAGEFEDYEVAEALAATPGFLVEAATPRRRYLDGSSWLSGWGHYTTEWLYFATVDEIAPGISAWAEAKHEGDKTASAGTATRLEEASR